ncbi:hypothetical protein ACIPYS_11890 [Kitasatospora sp. NPDC089913]|uniref:hypothetical protein n=1 Tax=Kitasatospora sp. NPDC089913 TaxID=3364080 RepID=UPI003813D1A4
MRELMLRAVAEVQPDPAGLQRIRRAVPRRRAARRGAWTGVAAVAVVASFLLPALHTTDHLGLSGGPGSSGAGSGSVSPSPAGTLPGGSTGGAHRPPVLDSGAPTVPGSPSGSVGSEPSAGGSSAGQQPGTFDPSPSTTDGGADTPVLALCTRADLGQGTAQLGAPDADGRIYGSFTMTNVSGRSCRLGGPGSVTVTGRTGATGSSGSTGADNGRIRIAFHTAGDPATGLPAPGPSAGPAAGADAGSNGLVLAPRAVYRVDIAWIPDPAGCPVLGGTTSPSASAGSGGASSTGGAAGGGAAGGATGGGATGSAMGNGGATGGPGTGGGGALPGAGGSGGAGGPSATGPGPGSGAGAGPSTGGGAGPGPVGVAATGGRTGGPGTSTGAPAGAGELSGAGGATEAAPAGGPTGSPSTTPQPSGSTTGGSTGTPSPSATPVPGPGGASSSVTLAYTPAPGNPASARVVLADACAGTVYRTAPRVVVPDARTPAPGTSPSAG